MKPFTSGLLNVLSGKDGRFGLYLLETMKLGKPMNYWRETKIKAMKI
jgi:hypothetical protein